MTLLPETSVLDIKEEIRRSRRFSSFHEIELFQGDRVLKDNDAIEMPLPQRFALRVAVDKVNLNVVGSHLMQDWRDMIQDSSCVCTNFADFALPDDQLFVDVQAVVSLSWHRLMQALESHTLALRDEKERAVSALETMPDKSLDETRSEELWRSMTSRETPSNLDPNLLGKLFARLCSTPKLFVYRLIDHAAGVLPGWQQPLNHYLQEDKQLFALAVFSQLERMGWHAELDRAERHLLCTAARLTDFSLMKERCRDWQSLHQGRLSERCVGQVQDCLIVRLAFGDCLVAWEANVSQIEKWNDPLARQLREALAAARQSIAAAEVAQPSSDPQHPADEPSDEAADDASDPAQVFAADTVQAIQISRLEVPAPPLSVEGTVLLRLTRMACSERLQEVLDTSHHLEDVRSRLREAHCEMRPAFTLARTFIPLTEAMLTEADLELDHNHIIALRADYDLLVKAIGEMKCRGKQRRPTVRPKLDSVTDAGDHATSSTEPRAPAADEDADEDEELAEMKVELVGPFSIRTDSDVGMPALQAGEDWEEF